MKKAIGIVGAIGGVLVLMYKAFDLGCTTGKAMALGSAFADDPSKELSWSDMYDHMSEHFSIEDAAAFAGYTEGRKVGNKAFKEFAENN